ncbi:hypothetical protein D3C75_530470 [compost metagenome]
MQLADAGHPAQFVVDVARGIVTQSGGIAVLGALLVVERIDQQETGTGLLHLQPLGEHGWRHACFGLFQAILHVNLGKLRISAGLERNRNLGDAVGVVGRLEIQQVFGTIERLLDHAGDRVHQHFRRSTRIGRRHLDLRRRNVGILRHRQHRDDQQTGQRDEQRHHPSKIRAFDEKLRHRNILAATAPLLFRLRRLSLRVGLSRCDLGTRLQTGKAADNHLIARLQSLTDLPARTLHGAGDHIA